MRKLVLLVCLGAAAALLVGAARGAEPVGTLSLERGKGHFLLEVRGAVVLGRITNGSITVVDRSPNDSYVATVTGRRVLVQRRVAPNRVFVRGHGLRFRMLGGSFRIVIHGSGVALSVVGRGVVTLDGEPRTGLDDVGVYSLDGTDCSIESQVCLPIPTEPTRVKLEPAPEPESSRSGPGSR